MITLEVIHCMCCCST